MTDQERRDLLAERDDLKARADELDQAGTTQEAVAIARQAVAIEEQALGESEAVAESWEWIADRHRKLDQFTQDQDARQRALAIKTNILGQDHWKAVDARLALDASVRWEKLTSEERKELREADEKEDRQTVLLEQGKYRETLLLEEQIFECRSRILGPEDRRTVDNLHGRAFLHKLMGEYAKAETLYLQSLVLERRILGEEHPDTANILSNLSRLYEDMGRLQKAQSLCQKALDIRRRTLGEEHEDTAFSLNNLASLYKTMGDLKQAESLYLKALDVRMKRLGEEHLYTVQTLNNLGSVYNAGGDLAKAEPLYRKALEITRRIKGEAHFETTTPLNNLALLHATKGEFEKALPLYQQALRITRETLGEEHPETLLLINNLAGLYEVMGQWTKAEPLYRKCLETRRKTLGEAHPDTALSYNNLASLYENIGDYGKAEPLYQRALEIRRRTFGGEHQETARSLGNLAVFYERNSDYAKARPLHEEALKIKRKTLGDEHVDTGVTMSNVGLFYIKAHEYDKAEPLLLKALDITRKALGEQHPDTAVRLTNLALLHESRGDYGEALPLYQQALDIRRKTLGEAHRDTTGGFLSMARIREFLDEDDEAAMLYRETLNRILNQFEATAVIQSQRQQLAMIKSVKGYLDNSLSFFARAGRFDDITYRQVLAWKGSILLRQRAIRAVAQDPGIKADFAELEQATRELARLALQTPSGPEHESRQARLDELSAKREALEAQLASQSRAFREAMEPVTLEMLQTTLPSGAVLVDFLEYDHFAPSKAKGERAKFENRIAVFLISRDRPVRMLSLPDADSIGLAVETWREGFGRTTQSAKAGSFLRERLWQPLEQDLQAAKVVLISPDGALGKLPFAALPGKEPGTYLIEERAIAVVAAPQDLPRLLAPAKPRDLKGNVLLVGDVDYDADAPETNPEPAGLEAHSQVAVRGGESLNFPRLSGTKGEMEAIWEAYEKVFPTRGLNPLTESHATEAAFREEAPRYEYLHIATHGFFSAPSVKSALGRNLNAKDHRRLELSTTQSIAGYHPDLLSGLALAGANHPDPDRDDGILTAAEVMSLDLSNANLVVLSACETGLGEVAGGEGLLGLQRAFQVAGAKTVVASLWQVEDAATSDLMQRFYANLFDQEKKMTKLDALREAQLWMLNERGPQGLTAPRGLTELVEENATTKRLPPFYWAAFVLSGDWR